MIDTETTGLRPDDSELIEIAAVRLAEDGSVLDTFVQLIKPTITVPDDIVALTGITNDMVKDGISAADAIDAFLSFVGEDVLVAHNAEFDIGFLQVACQRIGRSLPRQEALCTVHLTRILCPTLTSYGLGEVAAALGLEAGAAHRALEDAKTCAKVLHCLKETATALPLMTVQQLTYLGAFISHVYGEWFQMCERQVLTLNGDSLQSGLEARDGLVYTVRNMPTKEERDELLFAGGSVKVGEQAVNLLAAGGKLSTVLRGYEPREGQLQMVERVSQALDEEKHAVIEAGTGTGKSMAYLIPAALHASQTGERVVVSTHTIALQDQIERRDFPTLQRLFDGKLNLAVQKGRNHYVCLRKVKSEAGLQTYASRTDELVSTMALIVWLTMTTEGVREELATKVVGSTVWQRVQSETESCINKRCPFFRPCYYFRAKAKAQSADIVVTNHSLLLSDVKADNRVLPKYDALVIDEAHHLEEQATKHLGGEVHSAQLYVLSNRLTRDHGKNGILAELLSRFQDRGLLPYGMEEKLARAQEWVEEVQQQADVAFGYLGMLLPAGRGEVRLTDELRASSPFERFRDCMVEQRAQMKSLGELVKALQEWAKQAQTDEDAGRILDAAGYLDSWLSGIRLMEELTVPNEEVVSWIERKGTHRPRFSLHSAPIDVSKTLKHALFDPLRRVILTSATLSVGGKFDFTLQQLGLSDSAKEGRLITAQVASPFDYGEQTRLCVPSDIPEFKGLSAEDAAAWLADSLYQLAMASQGRLLALFTSHQMLKETARLLREPLRRENLTLLAQEIDGSRTAMLAAFTKNPRSVLLGAQSFWEGIDLPGNQLTTLVIVRLPFAPPTHPVTEARHERITARGKSPFWVSSLPEAIVRFRQGFGRLIRTKEDKGVVIVYDKRLVTQRYGQSFIRSLPGVRAYVAPEQKLLLSIQRFLATDRQ